MSLNIYIEGIARYQFATPNVRLLTFSRQLFEYISFLLFLSTFLSFLPFFFPKTCYKDYLAIREVSTTLLLRMKAHRKTFVQKKHYWLFEMHG